MSGASAVAAALILVVELVSVAAVAVRLTSRVCAAEADMVERSVVAAVLALTTIIGVLQVMGMVDLLQRGPVLVAFVVVAAAVLVFVPRGAPSAIWERRPSMGARLVALPAVFFGVICVALGLRGRSFEYDTQQYHVPNAAFWLQTHNLWRLPPTEPGYFTNAYPSNGELLGLWAMLPSHGLQIAFATPVAFGVLAIVASALIAKELGGPPCVGALTGLAVVMTPLVFQTQVSSMLTDLAAASGIVAAVALTLRAVREPGRARWPVLAGLALGIGVGSKDTALLPAIGVLVLLLWLLPRTRWLRSGGWLVLGALATGGFWFLRNAVVIGNPIYPQAVGHVLTGASGPLTKYSTNLFDHIVHRRTHPLHEWETLARRLVGPAAAIAVVGVLAPIEGLRRRPPRMAMFLVGGLGAACFAAYLLTPYTGGGTAGLTFLIGSQLRYMLPALLIAAAVAAAVLPRISLGLAVIALGYDGYKDFKSVSFRPDLHIGHSMEALALVVAIAVFAAPLLLPMLDRIRRVLPVVAVGTAVVLVVAFAGAEKRAAPKGPAPIDVALAGSGLPDRPVMAIGIADVSDLLGAHLQHHVVSPIKGAAKGSAANLSAADLAAALARTHPSAVAVGKTAYASIPDNWSPPGYVRAGTVAQAALWVAPRG